MNVTDQGIAEILKGYKKITVVGLSSDATKPGQKVAQFMRSQGYDIVGVRPEGEDVAGFKCYRTLAEVPAEYRKFVDVFRKPEHIPQVVDDVLKVGGVEILWLQQGITHPVAESKAQAAGLRVVSDRCLHIEFLRTHK